MSLVLIKVNHGVCASQNDQQSALSDAAKAMSRKLRPRDSIYHLSGDLLAIVLPEADTFTAKRIGLRIHEEVQAACAHHGSTFDLTTYSYPDQVKNSDELEDILKSLLPEEAFNTPVEVTAG